MRWASKKKNSNFTLQFIQLITKVDYVRYNERFFNHRVKNN